MKQFIYVFIVLFVLIGCQEKKSANLTKENNSNESLQPTKYKGTQPTTPEATELYQPVPPKVTLTKSNVPSDAIVLFDGSGLEEWVHVADSSAAQWYVQDDGSLLVKDKSGDIMTKRNFGSIQLHIEWKSPKDVINEGQSRANSGIFIQRRYEIQIMDSNDNPTYTNGQVGAVYKQSIPLAMASVPSGEWNTYDIIYEAPEFENEKLVQPAYVTVLHNGVLIQNHFEIEGPVKYIGWPSYEAHGKAPIQLQDHGDNSRVSYRNIWVREL